MSFEDASDLAKARAVVLFLGAGELAGGGGDGAFVVPRAAAVGLCKAFGVGLGEAAAAMADLAELDQLSEAMSQQYAGADLADIDLEALARQLGDDAAVDARTLAELEKAQIGRAHV